ncbi:MAG: RDD family protein [Candidatus Eremiobacter antarcticus]|nr:RDD family protein [Candidatus Eremiobacteraeota bacterium]MBC5807342.1 RDD family protein [Candidatus Eremiobacteraeota bacterium]PZR63095.1 MAG: RDD family protein [Candidatus Eremiobacter sp. RRmetagenome_bin22]
MERSVTIRTPESIAFYYELAGLGSRFLALVIDGFIQLAASIVLFIGGIVVLKRAGVIGAALRLGSKNAESTALAVGIVLFFLIWYGYFIFFEQIWNGQTPGKRVLGIRTVRDGGYPVAFIDSCVRNLTRIVEQLLGFYALSVVSMVLSSQNKRLGDYAAGTLVIRDRAFEVSDPKVWLRPGTSSSPDDRELHIAALSPYEIALAERYSERRTTLDPDAARKAAAKIAAVLRPKLGASVATLGDDELLTKIALAQYPPSG